MNQVIHLFRQSLQECLGVPVELSEDQAAPSAFWWEFGLGLERPSLWLGLGNDTASSLHELLKAENSVDALRRIVTRFTSGPASVQPEDPKRVERLPDEKTVQSFRVKIDESNAAVITLAFTGLLAQTLGAMDAPPSAEMPGGGPDLDLVLDIEMPVSVSFGRALVSLRDALRLAKGSVVDLDTPEDAMVDVIVNKCVVARGEVVVVDGNYGIRINQIISRAGRMELRELDGPAS